jgi:hypothetical protein
MLKIRDLKVNYGGIEAVKGISFDVPKEASLPSSAPTARARARRYAP